MARPMSPREELVAVRRAVEEAQRHVRALRTQAGDSRLAGRLENDVRRVIEDIDDLTAEAAASSPLLSGMRSGAAARVSLAAVEPVPVPARAADESDFHPECDDEGVGGGWRAPSGAEASGRRRRSRP